MESKSNTLDFLQYFTKEIYSRNQPYQEKAKTLWKLRVLLNHLQNSLEYEDITDTWFDEFKITGPNLATRNQVGLRRSPQTTPDSTPILRLSGRYLVRPTVKLNSDKAALRENLIELNQKKQRALTSHLKDLPVISELRSDVFKTSGKGDLENTYFTYFEFEIILD